MSTENQAPSSVSLPDAPQKPMTAKDYLRSLGPGILLAGAAIGGSHIFQSTRAGANFGWGLIWAVALANILKYPFFDYAIRYQSATGNNLLTGFKSVNPALLIISLIVVFVSGALNISALTLGTGILLWTYINPVLPEALRDSKEILGGLCIAVSVLSLIIIMVGRYRALDIVTKVIISSLSIATILAFFMALSKGMQANPDIPAPDLYISANVGFMLALMGWMPLPIDGSIWPTVWSCEKAEEQGHKLSLREQLFDFNFGYISAALLAFFFLGLGALVLYRTEADLGGSNIDFTNRLIALYGSQFGEAGRWLIGIAASTALFSSALTCYDAYPRTLYYGLIEFKKDLAGKDLRYKVIGFFAIFYGIVSAIILYIFLNNDTFISTVLDVATIVAFLTAPIMAGANLCVVLHRSTPANARPNKFMLIFGVVGIGFLTLFSLMFIWINFLSSSPT